MAASRPVHWLSTSPLIGALWLVFVAVWLIGSLRVGTIRRVQSGQSQLAQSIPIWIGALLLMARMNLGPLNRAVLPRTPLLDAVAVALVALGVSFAIWARVYLGRNWSVKVTLKEGHTLVQGGPYRWVRHPIYTGVLTALLGTAISQGRLAALCGVVAFAVGFMLKIRLEKRWLLEEFGDRYREYQERVKGLVPFLW